MSVNSLPFLIKIGDVDSIKKEINSNSEIDLNEVYYGMTLLLYACYYNKLEVVQELLKFKQLLDINKQDADGYTPLMWACFNNNLQMVQELLKHEDLDINKQTNEGNTALLFACNSSVSKNYKKFLETGSSVFIVQELLKHPLINVNLQDNFGNTALMVACINGHIQIVQELLKNKKYLSTKLNFVVYLGWSIKPSTFRPVDFYKIGGCNDHIALKIAYKFIKSQIDIESDVYNYFTELEQLVELCGSANSIIGEVDVNKQRGDGYTAIMIAYKFLRQEIITEFLLNCPEIDMSIKNKEGSTMPSGMLAKQSESTAMDIALKYGYYTNTQTPKNGGVSNASKSLKNPKTELLSKPKASSSLCTTEPSVKVLSETNDLNSLLDTFKLNDVEAITKTKTDSCSKTLVFEPIGEICESDATTIFDKTNKLSVGAQNEDVSLISIEYDDIKIT